MTPNDVTQVGDARSCGGLATPTTRCGVIGLGTRHGNRQHPPIVRKPRTQQCLGSTDTFHHKLHIKWARPRTAWGEARFIPCAGHTLQRPALGYQLRIPPAACLPKCHESMRTCGPFPTSSTSPAHPSYLKEFQHTRLQLDVVFTVMARHEQLGRLPRLEDLFSQVGCLDTKPHASPQTSDAMAFSSMSCVQVSNSC